MNDIKQLFFHLTPSTLAAIVAELDTTPAMYQQRQAAIEVGIDNCGDDFYDYLAAAILAAAGNQQAEDLSGYNGEVAASLARQS